MTLDRGMSEKVFRTFLIARFVMLVLSEMVMSTAGGRVPWFCFVGVFAIPPIVAGPRRHQVIGVIALVLVITVAIFDYKLSQYVLEMK